MLNSLLWGPTMWCAMAIVAHEPNGHAEVGIFNAANQWFSLLLFLPTLMNQAAFPILTERLTSGATSTAWRLFYGKLLVTILGITPAVILVAFLSSFIMSFYGPGYSDKGPILVIVAIAAWFAAPQVPVGNLLVAHALPWSWFKANLVWAGCVLVVSVFFSNHGALTLACAYAVAYAVRGLYASRSIHKLRRVSS